MTTADIHTQALLEADARLSAAGYNPDMAAWVCDQVSLDLPAGTLAWALAVAGDVRELCTDVVGRVA